MTKSTSGPLPLASEPPAAATRRRPAEEEAGICRPRALRIRLIDAGERVLLVVGIGFSLSANFASHRGLDLASLATDLLVAAFVVVRRPAKTISLAPLDWLLGFGASLGVLLMRPGGQPLIGPGWALALIVPGWLLAIAAVLSLNRAFGVVPANRGIVTRGPYAVIRHPMYLGYFLGHTAYLLLNPTALNLAVWFGVTAAQTGRLVREERLLGADPAYLAYRARVRFRLIPRLI